MGSPWEGAAWELEDAWMQRYPQTCRAVPWHPLPVVPLGPPPGWRRVVLDAFVTPYTGRPVTRAQEAKMGLASVIDTGDAQGMPLGQAVAWLLFHLGRNAVPAPQGPGSRALSLRTFLLNNKINLFDVCVCI